MQAQGRTDTAIEIAVRRALHRRGLRFRLHVRLLPETRRTVDIVFPVDRVAVDVRGCFWHSCPVHGSLPKANARWWFDKLRANEARDLDTERRLAEAGWTTVVVWEHDDPEDAATRIASIVAEHRANRSSSNEPR